MTCGLAAPKCRRELGNLIIVPTWLIIVLTWLSTGWIFLPPLMGDGRIFAGR
jgi:hypothetical protein